MIEVSGVASKFNYIFSKVLAIIFNFEIGKNVLFWFNLVENNDLWQVLLMIGYLSSSRLKNQNGKKHHLLLPR